MGRQGKIKYRIAVKISQVVEGGGGVGDFF